MVFRVPDDVSFTASNTPNASTAFNVSSSGDDGFLSLTEALSAGLIADGDTVPYLAEAVDADGVPEGAYEAGIGTFADATPDTLTRTTVTRSTNSGSAVDFSAATAVRVSVALPAEALHAPLTRVEQSGSGAASLDFLGFESGYSYVLELERVSGVANSTTLTLWLRMRRTGQGSFDSGATDYEYIAIGYGAGSFASPSSTGAAQIALTNNTHYGTGSDFDNSGTYISGEILIHVPQDSVRCCVDWRLGYGAFGAAGSVFTGWGYRDSDAAVQGVQLLFSTGDIEGKAVLRRLPRVR